MPWLPNLAERHVQPEVMDDPGLGERDHEQALAGLARLNYFSASSRILWPPIRDLAAATGRRSLRVLDLASGGGDVPIHLWLRAHSQGVHLTIVGCDISPVAVETARRRARAANCNAEFQTCDVLRHPLPSGFDVITSSLFLHHLPHANARELLRRMAGAGDLVLVNDLERSRAGYLLAWAASRVLCRSSVVHIDAPRSVENAFTLVELKSLADDAGLSGATVDRRWPCRLLLKWQRSG